MKNKTTLSFQVSIEAKKKLKKMAIDQDKTMSAMLEELITIRWEQTNTEENGTL